MLATLTLVPHPDTPAPFVNRFEVRVSRSASVLSLDYQILGDTIAIAIPAPAEPAQRDGLWRTTCFEAFVCERPGGPYVELNLSPSNEWAAYAFDSRRDGMRSLPKVPDPEIGGLEDEGILELWGAFDLNGAPGLSPDRTWRVGLAAVIEDEAGGKSYWALAHPPGEPDFHHEDCFALELPAPKKP